MSPPVEMWCCECGRNLGHKHDCSRGVKSRETLERALRNCLAMAVRMQRRGVPRHHEQVSIPGDPWTDIVRFCAEAGVVPSILREDADAT